MPINLKNTIFERFYSLFDKRQDPNKDVDGKGTLERYNEVIGQDVDDNVNPLIDYALDNLTVPATMYDRYIPYKEADLGNIQLFLSFDPVMRKRIIKHWHRYVNIKGTIRCYEVLFAMLGITAVITEIFDTGGFDSATTWDSDIRPTLDSGRCKPCSFYSIAMTGPPLTTEIYNAILSIILFNEPINADLLELTYNGSSLLVIVGNWQFQTNRQGTFTAGVINSGATPFWTFDGVNYIISNAPTYNYLAAGTKTVNVFVSSFGAISGIDMESEDLVNTLDLSSFTALESYAFAFNPNLTAVVLPTSSTNLTLLNFNGSSIVTINLSTLDNVGGVVNVGNNPFLSTLTLSGAKTANPTTYFNANNTALSGTLDLEPLTFAPAAEILIQNVPGLTTITLATTTNNDPIQEINVGKCSGMTTFDFSELRGDISIINFQDCGALTTLAAGTGYSRNVATTSVIGSNTGSLSGTIDLTALPIGGVFIMRNSGFSRILHQLDSSVIDRYDIKGSTSILALGYTIKNLRGLLGADNSVVDVSDCNLAAAAVDQFISDIEVICTTYRGETPPGSFVGREVYLDGSNAAPTAGGLANIVILANLGIAVFHN
jgi:hypothetical protein